MHKGETPQREVIIMAQGKRTAWSGKPGRGAERILFLGVKVLIVCCFLAAMGTAANAQNNATVTGTVMDQSGAAIPDAMVTALSTQTGLQKSAVSDADGRYTILSLTPGTYDVKSEAKGFATLVQKNSEFLVGTTVTVDFKMQVSAVEQSVEVTASTPEIESTQNTVSRILESKELDDLPVINRSFANLAILTPGVQASGQSFGGNSAASAAISIGNAPTYQTGYVVDGVTSETGNQGGQYVQLAQDWVQEFSVLNALYPTEYGSSAGGVINTVLRSGGNQFHGRAYAFYQNAALNADPRFFTGTSKAPFVSDRIGGMVGGPIKKDKLFFFGGFERFLSNSGSPIAVTSTSGAFATSAQPVGTAKNLLVPWLVLGTQTNNGVPDTSNSRATTELGLIKIDYTPSSKDSFSIRGESEYDVTYTGTNGGAGSIPVRGLAGPAWSPFWGGIVSWTRTISAETINQLSFAAYNHGTHASPGNWCVAKGPYTGVPDPGQILQPYNYADTTKLGGPAGGPTPFGNPTGIDASVTYTGGPTTGSQCQGILNGDKTGILNDAFTHTQGSHEVKFGGYLRKYYTFSDDAHNSTDGVYTFAAKSGPFNPNTLINPAGTYAADSLLAPSQYVEQFPNPPSLTSFDFHNYAFGMFVQDSWRATQNLTLNVGLRYDFSNIYSDLSKEPWPALQAAIPGSFGYTEPAFHKINNDGGQVAPRIGLAWTPRHNQNTLVRGGFGLFYDQVDTASAAVYLSGNSWAPTGYSLAANVASRNPYCIGNSTCATTIPVVDELAVLDVLASALENYTLPAFPTSTSTCNPCTVQVGPNTYTIPKLTVPTTPQGNLLDIDPNYKNPGTLQGTIGIQHQFSDRLVVSADYVYHYGFHEIISVNNNLALVGTGSSAVASVINPNYTTGYQLQSGAFLKAKDLQLKAHYRDHRGDSLQIAYQFGYSNDDSVTNFAISAHNALTTNPFNPLTDYGPSSLDARHTFNASGAINMHWGFQLSPIVSWTSALPYTASSSSQSPGSGTAVNCPAYFTKCYPVVNGVTFSRDSLRGDQFFSVNARLSKTVRVGESRSFSLYFEGFNLTNRGNLGTNFNANVDITTGAAAFGKPITTASSSPRQFQVGGRFDF